MTLVSTPPFSDLELFKEALTVCFREPKFQENTWHDFIYIKQLPTEDSREFGVHFKQLLKKVSPTQSLPPKLEKYVFIWGLYIAIAAEVRKQHPKILDEAILAAGIILQKAANPEAVSLNKSQSKTNDLIEATQEVSELVLDEMSTQSFLHNDLIGAYCQTMILA